MNRHQIDTLPIFEDGIGDPLIFLHRIFWKIYRKKPEILELAWNLLVLHSKKKIEREKRKNKKKKSCV